MALNKQPPQQAGDEFGWPTQTANPLEELHKLGQSIWLDFIRRSRIEAKRHTGISA